MGTQKTRRLMGVTVAALVASAGVPWAWAQEEKSGLDEKSGLEAMGVDPAAAKDDGTPAPETAPEVAPAPVGEGQAIVERARDRIRRAQYVRFDAHMFGTGAMAGYTTEARGQVQLRRAVASASNPWLFRVTATTEGKSGAPATNYEMAMLANSREWVNHDERSVNETLKMAPGGKWLTVPNSLWPTEVFDRAPYSRVMRNATYTQEPGQEINGVECEVVLVENKPVRGAASRGRWYFGREDSFPRRFERLVTLEGIESQIVMEFTNVVVEDSVPPDVTEATLRVIVPEGYTEKREAPKAPPAPVSTPAPTSVDAPADAGAMDMGGEKRNDAGMGNAVAAPMEPVRPAPPRIAPEFELSKMDGTKVTLASMRGSVVVVSFFGTWAMAAEAWHPQLKSIVSAYEGVRLVPVAVRQREPQLAAEMLSRAQISEALLIGNEALAQAYGVQVYPAVAVVGADGTLIEVVQGCGSAASETTLRAALDRAKGTATAPASPSGEAVATDPKVEDAKVEDSKAEDSKASEPAVGEVAKQEPTK